MVVSQCNLGVSSDWIGARRPGREVSGQSAYNDSKLALRWSRHHLSKSGFRRLKQAQAAQAHELGEVAGGVIVTQGATVVGVVDEVVELLQAV